MVHINGKDIDVAGQSLMDFLNANDYEMGTFVVECNEEIIHKEDYKTYILRDGDVIEVVQFMGGGCGTSLMYRPIVRRFAFFHTLFLSLIDHIVCTVTCRQFPNLTFAPRKTCHIGSNLTFHSYHATAIDIIHGLSQKSKNFFDFLSKKRKMKRSILFHSFYNRKILLYTTITLSQLFL